MKKKKIFLFADWYEPGSKAGGPIRSCVNFVYAMQDRYEIFVFTSDRDLHSSEPYPGIALDRWIPAGPDVHLFYCSPAHLTWGRIRNELHTIAPDLIYLNSMFSLKFTIFPMLITRYRGTRTILSPRGMLRANAIRFKSRKKKIFLTLIRFFGFHREIHFLASDQTEVDDIRTFFGPEVAVTMISNFPAPLPPDPAIAPKQRGRLSMICVGRIHPIKNIDYLLRTLQGVKAEVQLTIAGNMEDKTYWQTCESIIAELPPNISVKYVGEIPNAQLPALLAEHHIFTLPTSGENFGHAIFEALALGKPALISDQTPWKGLTQEHAGWDLPLDRPDEYTRTIGLAAAFDQQEYTAWSRGARQFVENTLKKTNVKDQYLKLFS